MKRSRIGLRDLLAISGGNQSKLNKSPASIFSLLQTGKEYEPLTT